MNSIALNAYLAAASKRQHYSPLITGACAAASTLYIPHRACPLVCVRSSPFLWGQHKCFLGVLSCLRVALPFPLGKGRGDWGEAAQPPYLTKYHFSVMAVLYIEAFGNRWRLLKMPKKAKKLFASPEAAAQAAEAERLTNNIVRARSRVLELGYCNKWEFFCTLTLDGSLRDRYDLPAFVKALGVWIGNYNKRYNTHLRYILIPEQHKDGAYHMHGLLSGVAASSLCKNEHGYLDMPYYRKHFGYISLDRLRSKDKAVSYITKYISKGFSQTDIKSGKHLFYASKKLDGKVRVWEMDVPEDFKMDFENDFCGISWMPENWRIEDFVFQEIYERGLDDERTST